MNRFIRVMTTCRIFMFCLYNGFVFGFIVRTNRDLSMKVSFSTKTFAQLTELYIAMKLLRKCGKKRPWWVSASWHEAAKTIWWAQGAPQSITQLIEHNSLSTQIWKS